MLVHDIEKCLMTAALYAYKIQLTGELKPADHIQRRQFIN